MRILLTNDDGIHAEGLEILEQVAASISKDVWVVAPEIEQSGASHSLSLHAPVRVKDYGSNRFSVTGTPTDCVLLATQTLLPKGKRPALVLSGINRGSNVGDDITYSGTVAGAMEACLLDIPAIALSQLFFDHADIHWETAATFAPKLVRKLAKAQLPEGSFWNLNFPACAPAKVKGVRVAPQGKRFTQVALTRRMDPKHRPYFWIGGERENAAAEGTDVALLEQGYITVTPLKLDLTDRESMHLFQP